MAECASGKKFLLAWRCVFVLDRQAADASGEIGLNYDGGASGLTIYLYVGGNPISLVDANGLQARSPAGSPPYIPSTREAARAGYEPPGPNGESPSTNTFPQSIGSNISNMPNPASQIPGAWVGINYPWSMPNLKSVCEICIPNGNPFAPKNPNACSKDDYNPPPSAGPYFSTPGASVACTCVKWKIYEQ